MQTIASAAIVCASKHLKEKATVDQGDERMLISRRDRKKEKMVIYWEKGDKVDEVDR